MSFQVKRTNNDKIFIDVALKLIDKQDASQFIIQFNQSNGNNLLFQFEFKANSSIGAEMIQVAIGSLRRCGMRKSKIQKK